MSRQADSGLGTRLFALALGAVVLTSGCASVDFDYPKTQSTGLEDTAETYLARQIGDLEDQEPGTAGFLSAVGQPRFVGGAPAAGETGRAQPGCSVLPDHQ